MANDLGSAVANGSLDRHMIVLADPVTGQPYRVVSSGGGGGGAVVQTLFDTALDAMSYTEVFPPEVTHIATAGYYTIGIGAGRYMRVVPNPGLLGFQTLDGSYWKIVEDCRDVLALGAVINDPSFNNTAILNAAAGRGGLMRMPAPHGVDTYWIGGTTNTNAVIASVAGLHIEGDGKGCTIIKNRANTRVVSMFTFGADFQAMTNLTLDGNRDNLGGQTVLPNAAGVTAVGASFVLDYVEIRETELQGIIFGAVAHYFHVTNCDFHDIGMTLDIWGAGVKMVGSPIGGVMRNNKFNDIYGLTVPGPSGASHGGGAIALGGTEMTVDNNYMSNCYNAGGMIAEQNSGGVQGVQRDWTITNNIGVITGEPADATTYLLELSGQNYVLNDNIMSGGKGGLVAFETDTGFVSGNATVAGNVVLNTAYGIILIQVGGAGHGVPRFITIVGNKFKGQSVSAVDVSVNASQITVVANDFNEVTTPLVSAAAAGEVIAYGNSPDTVGVPWKQANLTVSPTAGAGYAMSGFVRYQRDGKSVRLYGEVLDTTNGTGSGAIQVANFPFTFKNTVPLVGKTSAGGMILVSMSAGANAGLITTYNSAYPGANGITLTFSGVVEVL